MHPTFEDVTNVYQTVIWDWNGTLLDDVQGVVEMNNQLFPRWGLPPFESEAAYRRVFGFPIREYYRRVGVTDAIYEEVAQAWAQTYMERCHTFPLRQDAVQAVERFRKAGLTQVILSASKKSNLWHQVDLYPALQGQFDAILGLDNIHAGSKVGLALDYLAQSGLDPAQAVLIGDTTHDAEVARAIGCRCLLVREGHQLPEILAMAGCEVVDSLTQAADRVLA